MLRDRQKHSFVEALVALAQDVTLSSQIVFPTEIQCSRQSVHEKIHISFPVQDQVDSFYVPLMGVSDGSNRQHGGIICSAHRQETKEKRKGLGTHN